MLIFMSPYKAIYPNKLGLIAKNPQGKHKHAKITLFIRRKFATTVTTELLGDLAETLPQTPPEPASVTATDRLGWRMRSHISLDQ